jgi:hypothetical protein
LTDTELGLRVDGDLTVDEGERPFLLHTRLLQEALGQCCVKGQLEGGGGAGVMHLSGAEMATGSKTFAAPLLLAATGRVVRRIALSAGQAAMTYPDTTRFMAYRTLPTVRYSSSGGALDFQGTAIFDLGIPDDLAPAEPIRVRLIWFFDVAPATGSPPSVPASEYGYTWEVRLHYFDADEHLPQTLGSVPPLNFSGTVPLGDEFNLLTTDFVSLPTLPLSGAQLAALHVKVGNFNPPDARLFLVRAELDYVADRLGRSMP